MESVRKERMAYMDLAKFAAIVLVCIGYACNLSSELDSKVLGFSLYVLCIQLVKIE